MRRLGCLIILIFGLIGYVGTAFAQVPVNEQAQRHFDRGTAAVEMAKSKNDFEVAAREFAEAARLVPGWPDVHYNLGVVREKIDDLDGAIASLKRYLDLAPQAGDAAAVRSQINKLEYRCERRAEEVRALNLLAGTWRGEMSHCAGVRNELRLNNVDGQLYAELPINYDAGRNLATNWQRIAVERQGTDISFSFRSMTVVPGWAPGHCDVRYVLTLMGPRQLEVNIHQMIDGEYVPLRKASLKKQ